MQDNQLTRLSHYINTGFPCDKNLPTDLHEFWNHREALSIESGLITFGNRIIVPREMRPEMLQYIHEGHQGKERCLLWARNTVFWPKMTYDIQELIEKCIICQEHGRSQPIIGTTQELPLFPWHTLATDIFYWKRMDFLIVADVFSKYFLVRKLANFTSASVDISPRVQRLIVRSFPYLPFKVVYKKGKGIPVADALSHVTPMDPEDNIQLPSLL